MYYFNLITMEIFIYKPIILICSIYKGLNSKTSGGQRKSPNNFSYKHFQILATRSSEQQNQM